ncbi:MAG: replication initiator protein [Microvirus sp.]|nr:MAG: replication initiator protein [Microvirus sp.]
MACVYPLSGYRSKTVNENGKREIKFNTREGDRGQPVDLPCGKCIGCTMDRAKVWGIRMYHEATLHTQNSFITLTYDDQNCPENLNPEHLRLFIKSMRKHCKFRYFACGEYGTTTRRPHYHAIIFGQDFLGDSFKINDELYVNPKLQSTWGRGLISIAPVNMATCMYVAGYVNKKAGDKDTFNRMSLRPGIGHSWLDKYSNDILNTETISIEGKEYGVPKKYLEWSPDKFHKIIDKRKEFIHDMSPDEKCKKRESLKSVEITAKAKLKLGKEKI